MPKVTQQQDEAKKNAPNSILGLGLINFSFLRDLTANTWYDFIKLFICSWGKIRQKVSHGWTKCLSESTEKC